MMRIGITLSSLLSMVSVFITLNFFKKSMMIVGITNVIALTMMMHIDALIDDVLNSPISMIISNNHVGNNIG